MSFLKVRPKKHKAKLGKKDKLEMVDIIQQELTPYIKREELQEYLAKIEKDEKKKQLWASLSTKRKIKLLKYVLGERREHGKR
jgi:hypothetical protein